MRDRSGRLRAVGAATLSVALAVACQAAVSPAPSPSTAPSGSTASIPPLPSSSAQPTPGLTPSAPTSQLAGHWEATGATNVYRQDGRLLALTSGGALLIGTGEGSDGFAAPTSVEVWDPGTGDWTEGPDLNRLRFDFAAVALSDDRVLVAGGLNGDSPAQSYSSAYIFDARSGSGSWSKTALMVAARSAPAAARLSDGRVLVAGGYFHLEPEEGSAANADLAGFVAPGLFDIDNGPAGAAFATAEVFDPTSGTWTATGSMVYARSGAEAVTLSDGRVLVVGSTDRAGNSPYHVTVHDDAFVTAEIYDPASGRFTLTGRLPAIDRAALEEQAPANANPMPEDDGQPMGVGSLVALPDGGAVLIGNTRWWKHQADMTRSFRFDARSGAWSEIGKPYVYVFGPGPVVVLTPGVRDVARSVAAVLADGRVLVAGGSGLSPNGFGTEPTDVAEVYDPATNSWTTVADMPDARSGGTSALLADGSVLLVGGLLDRGDEGQTPLTTAAQFVP